jgi:hypothetical protein
MAILARCHRLLRQWPAFKSETGAKNLLSARLYKRADASRFPGRSE